eukprot:5882346-Pleurochrysis_carterae.AAC.2
MQNIVLRCAWQEANSPAFSGNGRFEVAAPAQLPCTQLEQKSAPEQLDSTGSQSSGICNDLARSTVSETTFMKVRAAVQGWYLSREMRPVGPSSLFVNSIHHICPLPKDWSMAHWFALPRV